MKHTRLTSMAAIAAIALLTSQVGAAESHTAGQILDDTVVTAKVKAALISDPITKAHQISVDTYKGVVKLSGFVDGPAAERRALEVARNIEGAVAIDDDLEVRQ